jgi:hypothetical protein
MNSYRTIHSRSPWVLGWVIASLLTCRCWAVEPNRIWVDLGGRFSLEARLIEYSDGKVVLLRDSGDRISIAVERLSEKDREYLEEVRQRATTVDPPQRPRTAKLPEFRPLPELDLAPAETVAADGSILSWQGSVQKTSSATLTHALLPDPSAAECPSPAECTVQAARFRLYNVDNSDHCSRPMPVFVSSSSGQQRTAMAMSISSAVRFPGQRGANQLIRFNVETQKAIGVFDHPSKIRLIDHHLTSGRSLLLVGFDSLGHGGELAIGSGWDRRFRLSHTRKLAGTHRASAPVLRWARWVDDEHFLAVIDQTLGLWNIVSGEQLYRINEIDHRAQPAISAGRRLIAVPYEGEVQLFATATGLPLGRIQVEKQVPGVSFSPQADRLAIVTSRRLRTWHLPAAEISSEIESPRNLGTDQPAWIDSDLILSSSGVLSSVIRELPIWRYDIAASDTVAVGNHIAMFRKYPAPELSIAPLPHDGATNAMHWIDTSPATVDKQDWRILGQSSWKAGRWDDRDVQISAAPTQRR